MRIRARNWSGNNHRGNYRNPVDVHWGVSLAFSDDIHRNDYRWSGDRNLASVHRDDHGVHRNGVCDLQKK